MLSNSWWSFTSSVVMEKISVFFAKVSLSRSVNRASRNYSSRARPSPTSSNEIDPSSCLSKYSKASLSFIKSFYPITPTIRIHVVEVVRHGGQRRLLQVVVVLELLHRVQNARRHRGGQRRRQRLEPRVLLRL